MKKSSRKKKTVATIRKVSRRIPEEIRGPAVSPEMRRFEKSEMTSVVVENISPEIDGGVFAAKCVVGDEFQVEADIFRDGHLMLGAALLFRRQGEEVWNEVPMTLVENDRWRGFFIPTENRLYEYTVQAWADPLASWARDMEKRCPSYPNVYGDMLEGLMLLERVGHAVKGKDREKLDLFSKLLTLSEGASDEVLRVIQIEDFRDLVVRYGIRDEISRYHRVLELFVDRKKAEYGAWYEFFPRSQARKAGKHGTFRDCIRRLPDIKAMGFDVLYLPPIHPIGYINRKGKNNSLEVKEGDTGSPWAIGSHEGGHKSIHPELGTLKDFEDFVSAAHDLDMEVALDFALQCSPDHPYVREHPEWFYHLPDGSIRYAENPPKKYQDIYPINFHCDDWEALWEELRSIVSFWVEKGVKIFRVDNPHTKPLRFWQWMIREIQARHPDVIFLAEAFTRPKVMKYLAKAGFSQSYTYFTWRNSRWDLRQYLEELTQTDMRHYFRGNFFANTPDILHEYLQHGGRPAFKIRLALAATLSSTYGIYSGFELCENRAVWPGSEEYLDSEKYEIKHWDWNRAGNIRDYVARINRIRDENPALQDYENLEFYHSRNDAILCYGKRTPDNSNIIVVVANLDPQHAQEDLVSLPIWNFGLEGWQTYQMKDLITGEKYYWKGIDNYVRLDPFYEPVHIFRLRK